MAGKWSQDVGQTKPRLWSPQRALKSKKHGDGICPGCGAEVVDVDVAGGEAFEIAACETATVGGEIEGTAGMAIGRGMIATGEVHHRATATIETTVTVTVANKGAAIVTTIGIPASAATEEGSVPPTHILMTLPLQHQQRKPRKSNIFEFQQIFFVSYFFPPVVGKYFYPHFFLNISTLEQSQRCFPFLRRLAPFPLRRCFKCSFQKHQREPN